MIGIRRPLSTLLLSGSMAAALLAQGSPTLNVKLGLWEMTSTMSMAATGIDTSKMTPEQQAMVAGMMQGRGMSMPPTVVKTCMTKEKIASHKFTPDRAGQTCKEEVTKSSAASLDITQTCTITEPPSETHGEVHIEAVSPTSIKMNATMTSTTKGRGGPQSMNMLATGKWLSAECGDVK